MTKGDAGQNISKFASSSSEAASVSTSMPYISYVDLASWLNSMYATALGAVNQYFVSHSVAGSRSAVDFKNWCAQSTSYSGVFICDGYRLCRAAKLLMSLGYGNFVTVIQYDIYAMAESYVADGNSWAVDDFTSSDFGLNLSNFESSQILNSPNLSLFPLLAYHKICNDHYRNEKW